jgi:antimicrobial peptide system SdpB family protein
MKQLVNRLKLRSVHTEKLAIARFLLAFGMALTLLSNDMSVVANHNYTSLPNYRAKHNNAPAILKKVNVFEQMPPAAAKTVIILALVLVMTGLLPQVTGVLHVWACFCVYNYFVILNGGENVAFVLSVLLVPICLTDPRLNQWRKKEVPPGKANIIAGIAYFALQVQAAALYLEAGVVKLYIPEWREGTALYYYTSHYRLGAPDWLKSINELITLSPLVVVLSWGIIIFELLLFGCILASARIKRVFLVLGLLFHFAIIINFGLITFFFSMAALLILYLDDEGRSVKLLRKATGRTS